MRFRISRAGSYGLLCTGVTAGLWLLDFYHSGVSTIVSISVFLSILKQAILVLSLNENIRVDPSGSTLLEQLLLSPEIIR